jgi:hypothetical protein
MPRRKIDSRWRTHIFDCKREDPALSAERMAIRFEEAARAGGPKDWPSARTIRRVLDDWEKMPEGERRQYGYFRWPESMEDGSLPWEASSAALELLRRLCGFHRPPVRLVKWFWRVTQAAPKAGIDAHYEAATQLAVEEALHTAERTRDVEWYLAFQPWRSEEDSAAYKRAQGFTWTEPIVPFEGARKRMGPADEPGRVEQAFDIMMPGHSRIIFEVLKMREAAEQSEEADNGKA